MQRASQPLNSSLHNSDIVFEITHPGVTVIAHVASDFTCMVIMIKIDEPGILNDDSSLTYRTKERVSYYWSWMLFLALFLLFRRDRSLVLSAVLTFTSSNYFTRFVILIPFKPFNR